MNAVPEMSTASRIVASTAHSVFQRRFDFSSSRTRSSKGSIMTDSLLGETRWQGLCLGTRRDGQRHFRRTVDKLLAARPHQQVAPGLTVQGNRKDQVVQVPIRIVLH